MENREVIKQLTKHDILARLRHCSSTDDNIYANESGLQSHVMKDIRKLTVETGGAIRGFKVVQANESGVSDVILCVLGRFVAIELKRDHTGKASMLQQMFLDSTIKAGGRGYVAYTRGQVKKILRNAVREMFEITGDEIYHIPDTSDKKYNDF